MFLRSTLIALLLIPSFAPLAEARPITTPSAANSAALRWYYEQTTQKYAADTAVFPDVDVRDPAYGAAVVLKNRGIINGYSDGMLRTWAKVSRAESLKIILGSKFGNEAMHGSGSSQFPDVADTDWSAPFVSFALAHGIIHGYPDGTFRPQAEVSVNEARIMVGLPTITGLDGTRIATRGEVLRLVLRQAPVTLPAWNFGEQLSISGRDILSGPTPIRGLMVNWQIRHMLTTLDRLTIDRELDRMKALGFIGVSTEIGWDDMQPNEGDLQTPPAMDMLFEEAQNRGMWVSLMLAPHYTPAWLYKKYGDIRLYDAAGRMVPMGEYMTFSPSSPAAEDQITWQKQAAAYYARHPNLLALFLSNEQSYGNKQDVDFSTWADTRWQAWRAAHGLGEAAMPRAANSPARLEWARFRQDNLLEFLNRSYETVAASLPRFVPVSHKVIFYEATSAFAPNYGLHPTPGRLRWDIVGADIYGVTANVYPAQLAHKKPIMVVETNLPGDWDAESMRAYLVYQALQGISVQTIFRWNPCEDENCLFHLDGRPWNKALYLRDAAETVRALPKVFPVQNPNMAILLPTNAVAVTGQEYLQYQYRFDDLISAHEADPNTVFTLIWSDDLLLAPDAHTLRMPSEILSGLSRIYAILPATDRDPGDGKAILEWISSGGELYIDQDQVSSLSWLPRGIPGTTSRGAGKIVVCSGQC